MLPIFCLTLWLLVSYTTAGRLKQFIRPILDDTSALCDWGLFLSSPSTEIQSVLPSFQATKSFQPLVVNVIQCWPRQFFLMKPLSCFGWLWHSISLIVSDAKPSMLSISILTSLLCWTLCYQKTTSAHRHTASFLLSRRNKPLQKCTCPCWIVFCKEVTCTNVGNA